MSLDHDLLFAEMKGGTLFFLAHTSVSFEANPRGYIDKPGEENDIQHPFFITRQGLFGIQVRGVPFKDCSISPTYICYVRLSPRQN